MTTQTEALRAGEFLLDQEESRLTFAAGVVTGDDYVAGQVMGQITVGDAEAEAGTNTGTGTLTLNATTPELAGVQVGDYTVTCTLASDGSAAATTVARATNTGTGAITISNITTAAKAGYHRAICVAVASNAGTFALFDPDNEYLGSITVGATGATLGGFKTVIADATDFVLGDEFLICIDDVGAARFSVTDPNGVSLGNAHVGTTFASQLKFALAEGGTRFVVGDSFTVTVDAGSDKWTAHDPDAVDGSGTAAGILYDAVAAADADVNGTLVVRLAAVNGDQLTWKTGISEANKTAGIAALATQLILVQ